jgi:C-terminal processing protease CtpA/Prc
MLDSSARRKVVSRVKALVLKHHFNIGSIDYTEWAKAVDAEAPAIIAGDDETFENGVRDLLAKLKSSHTNFFRSDTEPSKPQHAIGATLRSIDDCGPPKWMFLDVYDNSPAARAGITPGHILVSVDGIEAAPPVSPKFRFGKDHTLTIKLPNQAELRKVVTVPQRKGTNRRPPLVEPQSVSHGILNPRVGLLKIPFFAGAFGVRFSKLLDAAVESLKAHGCDRLVIDLRGCLGGSLGFARLASYLCPDRRPIGYDITRNRLREGYCVANLPHVPMPTTRLGVLLCLVQFSIQDKSLVLLTQGLGTQPFHGRVAMLINEWTNSAGEMTAQFAKDTKLATVIGKKTMGNVLGSTMLNVGSGYKLYLPIFGWYSPNGSYSEGSGVQPDMTVDIDPDALAQGRDAQLSKALDVLN